MSKLKQKNLLLKKNKKYMRNSKVILFAKADKAFPHCKTIEPCNLNRIFIRNVTMSSTTV